MKTISFIILFFLLLKNFSFAQKDSINTEKNFIVKTDIFLPVFLFFNGMYEGSLAIEKGFRQRHSVQLSAFLEKTISGQPSDIDYEYTLTQINADYKFFLSRKKSYTGFYAGTFADELLSNQTYVNGGNIHYLQYYFGGGAIIGYQNYIKKKFVIDILIGLGANYLHKTKIFSESDMQMESWIDYTSMQPIGRLAINIGYRF